MNRALRGEDNLGIISSDFLKKATAAWRLSGVSSRCEHANKALDTRLLDRSQNEPDLKIHIPETTSHCFWYYTAAAPLGRRSPSIPVVLNYKYLVETINKIINIKRPRIICHDHERGQRDTIIILRRFAQQSENM